MGNFDKLTVFDILWRALVEHAKADPLNRKPARFDMHPNTFDALRQDERYRNHANMMRMDTPEFLGVPIGLDVRLDTVRIVTASSELEHL